MKLVRSEISQGNPSVYGVVKYAHGIQCEVNSEPSQLVVVTMKRTDRIVLRVQAASV